MCVTGGAGSASAKGTRWHSRAREWALPQRMHQLVIPGACAQPFVHDCCSIFVCVEFCLPPRPTHIV